MLKRPATEQLPRVVVDERPDRFARENELFRQLVHDLRGPLNLIVGYADLLHMESTGPLNAKQRQFVQMIRTGAEGLEREIKNYQEHLKSKPMPEPGDR
jgi:signal transduction histidine kinase